VRVTDRLLFKVTEGITQLPIAGPERDQIDYEIIARVQGSRDRPEQVYMVSLFLQVDARNQVSLLNECDPYAPQEYVTSLVRALWENLIEARDSYIQQVAPGLVKARGSLQRSGLIVP